MEQVKPRNDKVQHEWMTIEELAEELRCCSRSVQRHVVKKKTPIVWLKQPFGRKSRLLARRDSVKKYVEVLEKETVRRYQPTVRGR